MIEQVVEFARALRGAGVRVSLAEALDACECLRHIAVQKRGDFRLALRAALIKDPRDFASFDLLFEKYFRWHKPPQKRREPHRQTRHDAGTAPRPGGEQPGRQANAPRPGRQASESEPLAPTPPAAPAEGDSDHRQQAAETLLAHLEEGMALARRAANQQVQRQRADLLQRDLKRRLTPDENREVAAEVEKLARRLVSRESLRRRRARRGAVDLKRTLARSTRCGGIPFQLQHRRRAVTRHKLLVLCDVSGSVWNVAALLLRLVHLLQNQFSRTHSLVFVDRPVDVSALFERYPFAEALERLRAHPDLDLQAYSDFGNTFYELVDDFRPLIDRDTVVLILGDARTNQFDPMEWSLAEVRRRARRIVWLNPEPPERWNTHDSVIERYAPCCDCVLPCGTLAQLAAAAGRLLHP